MPSGAFKLFDIWSLVFDPRDNWQPVIIWPGAPKSTSLSPLKKTVCYKIHCRLWFTHSRLTGPPKCGLRSRQKHSIELATLSNLCRGGGAALEGCRPLTALSQEGHISPKLSPCEMISTSDITEPVLTLSGTGCPKPDTIEGYLGPHSAQLTPVGRGRPSFSSQGRFMRLHTLLTYPDVL